MKSIGVPYYDHSPNYFLIKLGGSIALTTYPTICENAESGVSEDVLMRPNAIAKFSLCLQK
jgi:hypothetical protein